MKKGVGFSPLKPVSIYAPHGNFSASSEDDHGRASNEGAKGSSKVRAAPFLKYNLLSRLHHRGGRPSPLNKSASEQLHVSIGESKDSVDSEGARQGNRTSVPIDLVYRSRSDSPQMFHNEQSLRGSGKDLDDVRPDDPPDDDTVVLTSKFSRQRSSATSRMLGISSRRSSTSTAGTERKVMRGHKSPVCTMAVLKTETTALALSGGDDGSIMVWSLQFGDHIATLNGHSARVSTIVTFNEEGYDPLAISGSWDENIKIWPISALLETQNTDTRRISPTSVKCGVRVFSMSIIYVEGGTALCAVGCADNKIRLYSLPVGQLKHVLQDSDDLAWTLCLRSYIIPDLGDATQISGPVLFAGCRNNSIRIWRIPEHVLYPFGVDSEQQETVKHDGEHSNWLARITSRAPSRMPSSAVKRGNSNALGFSRLTSLQNPTQQTNTTPMLSSAALRDLNASYHVHSRHVPLHGAAQAILERDHAQGESSKSVSGFFTAQRNMSSRRKVESSAKKSSNSAESISKFRTRRGLHRLISGASNRLQGMPHKRQRRPQLAEGGKSLHVLEFVKKNMEILNRHVQKTGPFKVINHSWGRVLGLVPYECDEELFIATVCRDTEVRIWSMGGELTKTLKVQSGQLTCVTAFDMTGGQGGAIIAAGAAEGEIRMWHHATGEMFRVFAGHTDEVQKVLVFPSPFAADDGHREGIVVQSASVDEQTGELTTTSKAGVGLSPDSSPEHAKNNELVVLSCSKDNSLRKWMIDEEKSLKVFHHGDYVRVTAMDVYTGDETIVISGADDGQLRGWLLTNSNVKHTHTMIWCCERHGGQHVQALAIYSPCESYEAASALVRGDLPDYLDEPFVVSTGEDGKLLLSSLIDGELFGRIETDCGAVTSIRIYAGFWPDLNAHHLHRGAIVEPFLVAGSEDKCVRVYSLKDLKCQHTLHGHQFGVTSLALFVPQETSYKSPQKNESGSFRLTKLQSTYSSKKINGYMCSGMMNHDPLIISGSFDNTVIIWSHSMGKQLTVLRDCQAHVTAVGALQLAEQPVVVAGDVEGNYYIWSLLPPFRLQHKLQTHAQEVEVLSVYDVEGRFPVLVGGHLDGTSTVWNLAKNELITVLEGHSAQVTAVCIFTKGGSLTAVASASRDGTVRVIFDFLDAIPDAGKILSSFNSDKDGDQMYLANHITKCRWPRISEAVKRVSAEEFFTIYFYLFKHALKSNRPDFLVEFLPLTRAGLVNSHNTSLIGEKNDLLSLAVEMKSPTAVRTIIDCWISFLSTPPTSDQDLYYDVNFQELSTTMALLAEHYPADYERLICSMKPVRVRCNNVSSGKKYMYFDKQSRSMRIGIVPEEGPASNEVFYFFPVPYFATGHVLMAFEAVCEQLDSVDIFNSEAGRLILQYTWETYGLRSHFYSMFFYILYVIVFSVDLLTFHIWSHNAPALSLLLMAFELAFDVGYIYQESLQFLNDMLWYLMHIWNAVDMMVFLGNIGAVILRLAYWKDTLASKVLLSLSIVAAYFNVLQYLRAYESTGPLVSMILTIAHDIKYLVFVLLLVLLGFTQAFWILTKDDEGIVFHSIDQSLLYSYSFMLGGFEPDAFSGATLEGFVTMLSVLYMLIMAILLLNLLIALMGNAYSNVQTKGLAQWRLELTKICIDMESSIFAKDHDKIRAQNNDVIYIRLDTELDEDDAVLGANRAANAKVTVEQLREGQSHLRSALALLEQQVEEQVEEQTKSLQKQMRRLERMLLEIVSNTRSLNSSNTATDANTGALPSADGAHRIDASTFDSADGSSHGSASSFDSNDEKEFGHFQSGARSTVRLFLDAEVAAANLQQYKGH